MFETVIWLIPLAALVAGLRRPRAALLVLLASLPLFGSPPGGPYLAALDVTALVAIATSWRAGKARRGVLDIPILAFVIIGVASLAPLSWHPPSWDLSVLSGLLLEFPYVERWSVLFGWRAVLNMVIGWLLYRAVRRSFDRERLHQLGWALAVGVGAVLVLGLAGFVGLIDLGIYRVIGAPLYDTRLHSLFFHSGWLAEYLVLAAPVAVISLLRLPRWGPLLAGLLVDLTIPVLLFAQQRGAWFCALLELLVVAAVFARRIFSERRVLRALLVHGLIVTALVAVTTQRNPPASEALVERSETAVSDLSNRSDVWQRTWNIAVERPVLGWGIGTFSPAYDLLATRGSEHHSIWLSAHNQYLMLFVERGGMAVASYLLVGVAVLLALLQVLRAADGRRPLAFGLLLAALALGLYGAVQYLFFLRAIEWLIWMLLGAVSVLAADTRFRAADILGWVLIVAAILTGLVRMGERPVLVRGDRSYGLHAPEVAGDRPLIWTSKHAALRVRRHPGDLQLEVANGHPQAGRYPQVLALSVDGTVERRLQLDGPGWHTVEIPGAELPSRDFVLSLRASPAFRPFEDAAKDRSLPVTRDIRRLGVALRPIRWTLPAPGDTRR